ncbi:MAG: hypothetical protein QOD63_2146 [Actinomycetota bacterium]|nr:hypothetical protein [Actinomycetota bacterium]
MGWCSEFGCRIDPVCNHPMVAGRQSCSCEVCGVGCGGRFGGCKDVWAAGPKPRPARKSGSALGRLSVMSADPGPPTVPSGSSSVATLDDERLQTLNDTIDRMGRQLRGVVKLLNQQQEQLPGPSAVPGDSQLSELGETVDRMGRELRGVLNLLIQQQATLASLTHAKAPPTLPVAPPAV